jgi:cytochrome b561
MMMSPPHRRPPCTSVFLSLLWVTATNNVAAQTAPRCDEFVLFDDFAPNLELQTITEVTDATTGQGRLTVQATLTGLGWIGIGWSADAMMVPGTAVMGTDCDIAKWDMFAYTQDLSGLAPFAETQQTLSDTSFIQNDTHSILRFTKPLIEDGELPIDATGGTNIFIWAFGLDNEIAYHAVDNRGARGVQFTACEGGTVPAAPVSDVVCSAATNETEAPSMSPTSTPSSSLAPSASVRDCSQFQQSVSLLDENLSMDYVVFKNETDGEHYLKARLTLQGQAWLSFGINELGSVSMVPGDAIIGIPESGLAVGKYTMTDRTLGGVQLFPDSQQTLVESEIFQDDTVTILTFTKKVVEPNELPIDASGPNNFMWAYGYDNTFITHEKRGAFKLQLGVCTSTGAAIEGGFTDVDTGSKSKGLWMAHGILLAIAWGLLAPLAIGSSMLRKFLPAGPLWLTIHFYTNVLVLVLTLISFIIAVIATQQQTPSGASPRHFQNGAHTAIGLAVMILVIVQAAGGYFRAPAPKKNPDGSVQDKAPIRVLWEFVHKGLGLGLLILCWYQVADGLELYANFFAVNNFSPIFLGITCALSGSIIIVYIYDKYFRQPEKKEIVAADKEIGKTEINSYHQAVVVNEKETDVAEQAAEQEEEHGC